MEQLNLLDSLEDALPIVETRFGIELRNKTDIFKVKVGDKIYYSDILDCLPDNELMNILKDKGIKANNVNRTKLVSLAKKSIRDLYVSREEISEMSNISCALLFGFILLSLQVVIFVIFIIYLTFSATY